MISLYIETRYNDVVPDHNWKAQTVGYPAGVSPHHSCLSTCFCWPLSDSDSAYCLSLQTYLHHVCSIFGDVLRHIYTLFRDMLIAVSEDMLIPHLKTCMQ